TRAEAGVGVDGQRQLAGVGDATGVDQYVLEPGDAEVGNAERTGGDAATAEVDRAEARALRQQGVVGVDGADDLQRRFGGEGGAEARAGRGLGHGNSLRGAHSTQPPAASGNTKGGRWPPPVTE